MPMLPFMTIAKSAAGTLGSTMVGCYLAVEVEANTNKMFYWMAPHWYANVSEAHGLSPDQLAMARYGADCVNRPIAAQTDIMLQAMTA